MLRGAWKLLSIGACLCLLAGAGPVAPEAGDDGQVVAKRSKQKMELKTRTHIIFELGIHVKGQTTSPGEVRVLERREPELKSMVKRRTGFTKEIIRTVFPETPL